MCPNRNILSSKGVHFVIPKTFGLEILNNNVNIWVVWSKLSPCCWPEIFTFDLSLQETVWLLFLLSGQERKMCVKQEESSRDNETINHRNPWQQQLNDGYQGRRSRHFQSTWGNQTSRCRLGYRVEKQGSLQQDKKTCSFKNRSSKEIARKKLLLSTVSATILAFVADSLGFCMRFAVT